MNKKNIWQSSPMGIKFDVIFESSVFRYPRPRKSRDVFLTSDWSSHSARKQPRGENNTGSMPEIPHASPHRSQPWRHCLALQPAWQPARQAIPQGNLHRARRALVGRSQTVSLHQSHHTAASCVESFASSGP